MDPPVLFQSPDLGLAFFRLSVVALIFVPCSARLILISLLGADSCVPACDTQFFSDLSSLEALSAHFRAQPAAYLPALARDINRHAGSLVSESAAAAAAGGSADSVSATMPCASAVSRGLRELVYLLSHESRPRLPELSARTYAVLLQHSSESAPLSVVPGCA